MKPIKREQLDKAVTAMFRTADRDGNGIVTPAELHMVIDERREARIRTRFERIDTDHDRSISAAEFLAWQRALGSVASSEQQSVADIGGPVSEAIGPELDGDERGDALGRVIEPLNAIMIVNANVNYDAGLSLDELLAWQRKRFDGADADHDGALTMGELRSLDPERPRRGPGGPGFPGGPGGRRPGEGG
jgi:Ca2+-binding EF-hand superfamily protein